jgi:iron complex transport system substrate-binding protein
MSCLLTTGLALAGNTDQMTKKRRQQGILTGMPFMANVAPRTFVDDLGRNIYLSTQPGRIVSLAPSVTEMLFAIGAGGQVVGVTQFCDYPPEAATRPKVGAGFPNIESVVALKPDLVVASKDFIRTDTLNKLEQLKVPVFVFLDARTVEDILRHIQTLGRMLNRSPEADALAASMRRRVAAVKAATAPLRRPRVLYVLNSDPFVTVGTGSFIHQVIELAGGVNVAGASPVAYPRLSMEEVLKQDPEVILFPAGETEGVPEEQRRRWRQWATVTAVRQDRFVQIPSVLLDRPGPRVVEGLERLARSLHAEAFAGKASP